MSAATRRALICGIGGQDGSYLAHHLLGAGYDVWGSSRDAEGASLANLVRLGVRERVSVVSIVPEDFRSVFAALDRSRPDEVYFLAGQSSVGLSFELPAETLQSIVLGTLNFLEACRMMSRPVRLYHAGSSECFGDTAGEPADEDTSFRPRSPYAVAKASASWLVANYREAYGLFACTGILFNHESPLRPMRFVTQKIVSTARRIAAGSTERLILGRLDVARDWGWAGEYVTAMHRMLQRPEPRDYVIATGNTHTLAEFVAATFAAHDLDWNAHVEQSSALMRPSEITLSRANPSRAARDLNWAARYRMGDVVKMLIAGEPLSGQSVSSDASAGIRTEPALHAELAPTP